MDAAALKHAIIDVARRDGDVKRGLCRVGLPAPRALYPGFSSLVRILVGQQLSVKAAASIHQRFEEQLAHSITPDSVMAAASNDLRSAGLSRAKVEYCKALAQAVFEGSLSFGALASLPVEDAVAHLCKVKGIGPWTAHIYLLFCEGRPDVWPAGDLALQEAVKRIKGLPKRPTAVETITLTATWQPYRGAMAIFLWHYYAASDAPV